MRLVIDASVALAWVLPDEARREADAVLEAVEELGGLAPIFFKVEVANVLAIAVRQRRIEVEQRQRAIEALDALVFVFDTHGLERVWDDVIELAERHQLTVYDALYLEAALRRGLTLATFDKALQKAAQRSGVPVFQSATP
ncbi:MAG: type II toxin-antitoxin system VapC family toxin [Roseitalea sp.]|nr:type II toxin-antitoxin system VapC family toxin [Roseitalea sp.]MBO6724014.1 type II toxin-antitoxin system VapC family toxin [Roseitalea sp.]MBO6741808.1 type II toxin-antitoxin system VapC family toxin [Roseitalea sp.]